MMLIFVFCLLSTHYVCGSDVSGLPVFPKAYITRGELAIPYAEITEPFTAFVDLTNNRSRIDYYGDMVRTYQRGDKGPYGVSEMLAPMSGKNFLSKDTCFMVNGTKDSKMGPQVVIPDMENFVKVGVDMVNGIECEKWELISTVNTKVSTYTLWLTQDDSNNSYPVKYDMLGYNSLLGSHFDHYIVTYDVFFPDIPDVTVFDVPDSMTCRDFPGPGVAAGKVHLYNPMHEFIHHSEAHMEAEFSTFKHKHNKVYEETEEEVRKNNFRQNLRFIHSTNRAGLSYTLAANHMMDYHEDEFNALRGRIPHAGSNGAKKFMYSQQDMLKLPESHDWRLYGAVTPVKDQVVCGSCWSFGTTGAIEGAYFLHTGNKVSFSEQALIDCSWEYGNNGCDGGEDFRSYKFMMDVGGLPTDADYGPYLGQDSYCRINQTKLTAKIKNYYNITSGSAEAMKLGIFQHGPISVAIDASHKSLSFYDNGVYYEPKCKSGLDDLDHAVLAVGYGVQYNQAYWLIKNSWSTYWGNDGYVLMAQKDNNCGVTTDATYVTMM